MFRLKECWHWQLSPPSPAPESKKTLKKSPKITEISILFLPALDERPPKVIVTGRAFDSVTLSFDHFAPEDYEHGYVAMVVNCITEMCFP